MRGVKTPVFMRFLEAEKQGLQYPDHQFKSGCRLSEESSEDGSFFVVQEKFCSIGKNLLCESIKMVALSEGEMF